MISGALGKKSAIRQTVKIAVPLLGCALAIAPCFKMRFWNIGAEGQITAGAIAASYFALFWANRLPSPVLLLVMGLAGALAGGLWALIPAFFKAKWNTNETLFTLMMNYIIIGVVRWLQGGPWEGRKNTTYFIMHMYIIHICNIYICYHIHITWQFLWFGLVFTQRFI